MNGRCWANRVPAETHSGPMVVYDCRKRQEGLSARVKIETPAANIKAASLWAGGNGPAFRALFMTAEIECRFSLTAHKKS